jgi:molecular chaperone GrpE
MKRRKDSMRDSQFTDEIIDEVEDTEPTDASTAEASTNDTGADTFASDEAGSEAPSTGDRISELERELTLDRDKYLRLVAEFDNFRKRMMKERAEAETRGQGELVRQILEPLDDIARFAHVDPAVTDSITLVEGVAMVEKKLDKSLRAAGLDVVNPLDEKFDPAVHEAVATEAATKHEQDGTVARVYQVGYSFKGQLLRPARVVVRQYQGSN